MTTRVYAHASVAAALLLTAAACYPALHPRWIALTTLFTAVLFAWLARRLYAQARRERAVWQRLELLDDEVSFVLPPPCCPFWLHSDGEVHAPDCPRSADTRADH
ncbi:MULTISPECIES: hypothetical protein [Streptomyces]|uniref:hypothetical protein n=1 Tax=Streptomyces TaxID=1883 RepID=UPI0029A34201|nr:hypothetical protein [Streptomyces stelliscabiei]MDX2520560.1 hypothetical protein [Streptomyces stelliscabiei]MDX2552657.1 hypothetical protein [Streptomyces stelliscabiei]MDX2661341.1 hypothetical protein [Streptomyces stelliscabiei]MDX2788822.1 hypothetical protein [Streptomyces stelliscabiei]